MEPRTIHIKADNQIIGMKEITVATVNELETVLADFGQNALYRGQVAHYLKNGRVSVVTSFDRKGCIPSVMMKWSRYSSNVLQTYIGKTANSLGFVQALLQHYGWRSFYVDCSTNAAVSSWFASHEYTDRDIIELSEDCDERPVMLVKKQAQYDYKAGTGHLYVLDRRIVDFRIGVVDLAGIKIEGARPRTSAQDAWLIGPLRNTEVPPDCFIAHVAAERSVFRDFAAVNGFKSAGDLFPSVDHDPILDALLGLPWKEFKADGVDLKMPFFRRALELPEYDDSFQKIASPTVAFYKGARVSDRKTIDGAHLGGITVAVPDIVLFGTADPAPLKFPKINELLREHGSVAFEIDDIIQHANMQGMVEYQKGIFVQKHEYGLIEVCELMVEHPGQELTGAGINYGWYYAVGDDGEWTRVIHANQCPCGEDFPHLQHISALHIVEEFLTAPANFN